MDPQQRLLLERGYEALHTGGLPRSVLSEGLVGIFIGIASTDYAAVLAASPLGGSVYAATGSSLSIASGRLSYVLGLHGPCATYATACSAALAASHAARRALQLGECASGLASGVNLMLTPSVGTSFAVAGMTSPSGRCHTFDSRADGYARGEACCSVSLKASAEEGHIGAIGSAVRQDGRSASLTAPSGLAQQGLLRASLGDAGVAASELACAEAHGTGTSLGDPIEAGSLGGAMLRPWGVAASALALGSGKANVGHAEPAAGATGLLRLVVQLQESRVAPNAQLAVLNPHVGSALSGLACALPLQLAATADLSTGGVGSFGYSGTIVHMVVRVDRSLPQPLVAAASSRRPHVFPWREPLHPLLQVIMPTSGVSAVFRSPAAGALFAMVAEHVVEGRVIFPAAGYLEAARALCGSSASALQSVFFLQPLSLSPSDDLYLECTLKDGRFEIGSSGGSASAAVHCSGAVGHIALASGADLASVRSHRAAHAAEVAALYQSFHATGLQYGPGYRALLHAWGGDADTASARLHNRSQHDAVL